MQVRLGSWVKSVGASGSDQGVVEPTVQAQVEISLTKKQKGLTKALKIGIKFLKF